MRPISTNKKFGLVFGITSLVIAVLLVLYGDKENPYQLTRSRLSRLEQAVTSFIEKNGRAPDVLAELGLSEEQLQDHLGEPFIYMVDDSSLTLLSFGSDKKPGGNFFKRDLSITIDLLDQE